MIHLHTVCSLYACVNWSIACDNYHILKFPPEKQNRTTTTVWKAWKCARAFCRSINQSGSLLLPDWPAYRTGCCRFDAFTKPTLCQYIHISFSLFSIVIIKHVDQSVLFKETESYGQVHRYLQKRYGCYNNTAYGQNIANRQKSV